MCFECDEWCLPSLGRLSFCDMMILIVWVAMVFSLWTMEQKYHGPLLWKGWILICLNFQQLASMRSDCLYSEEHLYDQDNVQLYTVFQSCSYTYIHSCLLPSSGNPLSGLVLYPWVWILQYFVELIYTFVFGFFHIAWLFWDESKPLQIPTVHFHYKS